MMSRTIAGSWVRLVSFGVVGSLVVALAACNTDGDAPDYFGDTVGGGGNDNGSAGAGGTDEFGGAAGQAGGFAPGGTGGTGSGGVSGASGEGGSGGAGAGGASGSGGSPSGSAGSAGSGGTAGAAGSGGSAGTAGTNAAGAGGSSGSGQLQWRTANLTNYTSYPEPGSEECVEYNGCEWAGYFAALDDQQTEQWVASHNIAAVHSKDFDEYKLKTLRLRQDDHEIDVVVYDMCADSDCSGCCTQNSSQTGFLIDLESYTAERFGSGDGVVEWACLDC